MASVSIDGVYFENFHLPEDGQEKWPKQVGALYNKHNNVQLDSNKFLFIRLLQGKCAKSNVPKISNIRNRLNYLFNLCFRNWIDIVQKKTKKKLKRT